MAELNIHQRLLEVRKSVKGLSKDAKNKHQGFDYVSSSNVVASLKDEMDNQGLLLIPSVESFEVRSHETKQGGNWFFTILSLVYTWVNVDKPEEKIVCKWLGCGLDSSELGVGKGLTYGEKYFLLKFFNIPTDGDDPDAGNKQNGKGQTGTGKKSSGQKSNKTRTEKITFIRNCLGDMGRWGFEEQKDGSIIKYKIEKQETVNEKAVAALKIITSFPGKDGKDDFTGFESIKAVEKLQDKWFNSVYGNVKTAHEAWTERFNNANDGTGKIKQETEQEDDLPF